MVGSARAADEAVGAVKVLANLRHAPSAPGPWNERSEAEKFAGCAHAIWPSCHDGCKSLKTEIGPREDAPASHRSASA
jgi:hypothetical protein